MTIENEQDAEYYQPEMEGARRWPLVVGVLLIAVFAGWSYVPAKVQETIYSPLMTKAQAEADSIILRAKLEAQLIDREAQRDAEAIRRNMAQDAGMKIAARYQETREPLIRLILENADKYGLKARRVGDFVNVDLK